MVHLVSSIGTLAITMVHNHHLLTHWLSLWYTTVFYWPNGPLCGTHPSSIGPLALPVVHYHLLLAHWPSLCEATIFSWPSCPVLWYTPFFYWPTGCLCGTLLSPTCPLAVSMVCKHRFCSSTDFVHIEQKWLATATEIVVLTKMVAISTDFVHFGQKW